MHEADVDRGRARVDACFCDCSPTRARFAERVERSFVLEHDLDRCPCGPSTLRCRGRGRASLRSRRCGDRTAPNRRPARPRGAVNGRCVRRPTSGRAPAPRTGPRASPRSRRTRRDTSGSRCRQCGAQRAHRVVGPGAAVGERRAEQVELLFAATRHRRRGSGVRRSPRRACRTAWRSRADGDSRGRARASRAGSSRSARRDNRTSRADPSSGRRGLRRRRSGWPRARCT